MYRHFPIINENTPHVRQIIKLERNGQMIFIVIGSLKSNKIRFLSTCNFRSPLL